MTYEPKKAAQLIAYLILRSGQERLNVLKAIKLVYLVDRESIRRFGFTVLDEDHYSMPHGPVNSTTFDYVNGVYSADADGWQEYLRDREDHMISLARTNISVADLDELSEADIECADAVWEQAGHMDQWQLRDWTHDPRNVPEWEDPNGSSKRIPLLRIMRAVGVDDADAEKFDQTAQDFRQIDAVFRSARGD